MNSVWGKVKSKVDRVADFQTYLMRGGNVTREENTAKYGIMDHTSRFVLQSSLFQISLLTGEGKATRYSRTSFMDATWSRREGWTCPFDAQTC